MFATVEDLHQPLESFCWWFAEFSHDKAEKIYRFIPETADSILLQNKHCIVESLIMDVVTFQCSSIEW